MLTRILTDNPAERFTRNFDAKFVTTTKELLREGRDMSVQQILRETLDYFETEKVAENPSLVPLMEMWKQEKFRTGGRLHNNAPVSLSAPSHISSLTWAARSSHNECSSVQSTTAATTAYLL